MLQRDKEREGLSARIDRDEQYDHRQQEPGNRENNENLVAANSLFIGNCRLFVGLWPLAILNSGFLIHETDAYRLH